MTNIEARISPGIKALDPLDRMDVFRLVVERADFESQDKRLCKLEVGDRRVCWKIIGSVIAIGLADEFSTPRNFGRCPGPMSRERALDANLVRRISPEVHQRCRFAAQLLRSD